MRAPVPRSGWQGWLHRAGLLARPGARDGESSRARWQRRVVHGLAIAFGWALFAWSWNRVSAGQPVIGELRVLLIGAVVIVPVVTLSWVAHNVGIHRRKGPRRAVPAVSAEYRQDFNGRHIAADWPSLLNARRIVILVDGDDKRFRRIGGAEPSAAPRAQPQQEPA